RSSFSVEVVSRNNEDPDCYIQPRLGISEDDRVRRSAPESFDLPKRGEYQLADKSGEWLQSSCLADRQCVCNCESTDDCEKRERNRLRSDTNWLHVSYGFYGVDVTSN